MDSLRKMLRGPGEHHDCVQRGAIATTGIRWLMAAAPSLGRRAPQAHLHRLLWLALDVNSTPGEASIRQLNPSFQGAKRRALEEVGTPPQPPEIVVVWPDSSYAGISGDHPALGLPMVRAKRGHHPLHLSASAARISGAFRLFEKGALRSNPNRNELRCRSPCSWQ